MIKEIDKLAWLYIKEGKLLAARSKNKALFYIPGGKREEGESDEIALKREIEEEISVAIIPSSIKYANTFTAQADGRNDNVIVRLTCYFAEFKGAPYPNAEIEEIVFIAYEDRNLCSIGAIKVMDWLKKEKLIL